MLSAPGNPQIPRYFFQDKIKFKIYDTFMYTDVQKTKRKEQL